jgi:hypothetical protein
MMFHVVPLVQARCPWPSTDAHKVHADKLETALQSVRLTGAVRSKTMRTEGICPPGLTVVRSFQESE